MLLRALVLIAILACVPAPTDAQEVSTIAGTGVQGFSGDGGPALLAMLDLPGDVEIAPDGTIYFADIANFRIRRISTTGIIETVAGNGLADSEGDGGLATSASFIPHHIALDAARNRLYIADGVNNVIRRVNLATGTIDSVAVIVAPQGIVVDAAGDLYVSETPFCQILKVSASTGDVSLFAGGSCDYGSTGDGGPVAAATFSFATRLAIDRTGNLFVIDHPFDTFLSDRVRRIDAATGIVTTVAGGGTSPPDAGPATSMFFGPISAITVDPSPGGATRLFMGFLSQSYVIDLATGQLSILAGNRSLDGFRDGPASEALFRYNYDLAVTPSGGIVVGDIYNHRLRLITPSSSGLSFIGTDLTTITLDGVIAIIGDLTIVDNPNVTIIDLGTVQQVDGNLTIVDNAGVELLDLGNVQHVDGNLTIVDNGSVHVDLSAVQTIGGNLSVQSHSTGTAAYSVTACPSGVGSNEIDLFGYARVTATAPPNGWTTLTMDDGSVLTLELEPGTFDSCVPFSIVGRLSLPPGTGLDGEGEAVNVDFVVAYEISFELPVLGRPATLTFDIELASLSAGRQQDVLQAYNAGLLTVATTNYDLGQPNTQTFPICANGQEPTAGGCVTVLGLDADGIPTLGMPAIIRLTGVVGHFSTWGVAIVTPVTQSAALFNGLLQPYPAPPHATTPTFKRGSVVPLKFNWLDPSGAVVDSATAAPRIAIYPSACTADAPTTSPLPVDDAGQSGGLRYDADARTWVFGWSTKGLTAGCYSVEITPGDSGFGGPASVFPLALREK